MMKKIIKFEKNLMKKVIDRMYLNYLKFRFDMELRRIKKK